MRLIRRLGAAATTAALITTAAGFLPARAAVAPPATLTIGIDNATPAGHNWEFLDYYPRGGVNIHNLSVIHFKLGTAPDAFHTATLGACAGGVACASGASTETAGQIQLNFPQIVPDNDAGSTAGDSAGQRLFSNKMFFATNPPAGSGAPGACGDATTPCPWDGSKELNSGALSGGTGTDYYYKINLGSAPAAPITVNYFCAVHGPTMKGSFTVVPDATPESAQSALDTAAAAQYTPQLAQGTSAESAASTAAVTTNSNGTKTYDLTAGTESPDGLVQVLEMLPQTVNIQAGDTVRWTSKTNNDPHTVTFPQGTGSNSVDPISGPFCEDPSTGDAPPTGAPPCGGNFALFELHYNPGPQGATAIAAATTAGSSGTIEAATSGWEQTGTNYSFGFPNVGTFAYQCRFHDNMTGQILAAAVVPPALPKAGSAFSGPATTPVPGGSGIGTALLVLISLFALIAVRGLSLLVRRRAD
jgi:plastocyanin